MALLEVTQWRESKLMEGERWEHPFAINPVAIMTIAPADTGCDIEMMAIRESGEDYVATYRIVESYETLMRRLGEIGA